MLSEAEGEFLALHEIVKAAHARLDRNIWDYLIGGTETETTVRRNRLALDSLAFRPRVLRDVSRIDASGSFFGHKIRLPVALAPVGSLESFEAGGGASVARTAAAFGVPVYVSSVTQPGLEATAAAAAGAKVFQLYVRDVRGDQDWVDAHVGRALAAGYEAFCPTVDTCSARNRNVADAQSRAVSDADWLRLAGVSDARCLALS